MSNETEGAGAVTTEPERVKIANRQWVNDAGEEVAEDAATGVKYEFLGRTKGSIVVPPDGKSYTVRFSDLNDKAKNMLTGFGALTLMGNITNTWLGEKGDRDATAADAIAARIALLQEGQWIDRSAAGGFRIDLDALTSAYVEAAAAKGQTKDPSVIREKLGDDTKLVAQLRKIPEVAAAYTRIVGKSAVSLDDVMASL